MGRRILLLAAAILLIAAGLYLFYPGPEGDYSKVLVLKMHFSDGRIVGNSAEVRYGHAPQTSYRTGPLQGKLLTAEGKVTREFSLWDPSVQLGDGVETDAGGTEVFRSVTVTTRDNNLILILPYTGKEKSFALYDKRTGRSLTTLDLTAAGDQFEKTYPADPDTSARGPPLLPSLDGLQVMFAMGVFLMFILMIVVISMLRHR